VEKLAAAEIYARRELPQVVVKCRFQLSHTLRPAAQRIGLQLQQAALPVNATPQKSRRQNATELRNA